MPHLPQIPALSGLLSPGFGYIGATGKEFLVLSFPLETWKVYRTRIFMVGWEFSQFG